MKELFIAKRYLKAKHKINFISILSFISWVGISLGVAALVIVISVFNGFGDLVKDLLLGYDPHIIVYSNSIEKAKTDLIKEFSNDMRVKNISSEINGKALIYNSNYNMVIIKGLEQETLAKLHISKFKDDVNLMPTVYIGQILAAKIGILPGDTILLSSLSTIKQSLVDFTTLPRISKAIVGSIYLTNNKEYDDKYIFANLNDAITLLGSNSKLQSIEIRLKDINDLADIKNFVEKKMTNDVKVSTWYDLHKDLYDVMQIERWSAFILLTMIIVVSVFNILSTLTMMVIEKRRDIGILKTVGFTDESIKRLFVYQGFLIGFLGIIFGLIVGLTVCYIQIEYKFYALDPTKYIIDALPVKINLTDLAIISFATLALTALASVYPAKKANEIKIIDSIKYE